MLPPILIIHGACSQASHMEPWVSFFRAAGYEVVAPSLPGHGPTDEAVLARMTIGRYAKAALEAHSGFNRPPIVIGHSMGGLIAQHLAARFACAGLVLVASVPPFRLTARLGTLRHALPVAFRVLRGKPFRPTVAGLKALTLHDLSPAEQEELLADFSGESGLAFRQMAMGLAALTPASVHCPVLCVSGSKDRLIPQRVYRALARLYDADEIVIPGRGHWLFARSLVPTVAGRVLDWIGRLPGREG